MIEKTLEEFFLHELTQTDKYLPLYGIFGYRDRMSLDKKSYTKGHLILLIIDKDFNVVYKSDPAYNRSGNYTKKSLDSLIKFGLFDKYSHTECTMDDLLKNLFTTIYLSYISQFNPRLTMEERNIRESKCSSEFIEFNDMCTIYHYLTTQAEIELNENDGVLDISYRNQNSEKTNIEKTNIFLSENKSVTPVQDAFSKWIKSKGLTYTHVNHSNQLPFMKKLLTEITD